MAVFVDASEDLSRTENSARNTVAGVAVRVATILVGYVARVVFTHTLAQVYVGVNGLFSDIMNVLSLTELGLGSAIAFALYEPLAKGDTETVKSVMALYRRLYRAVALIVAVAGLALVPALPLLIADYAAIDDITLIYLLYLANSVLSYLFVYKQTLIEANQLKRVPLLWRGGFQILQSLGQIVALLLTRDFVVFQLVGIACTVGYNLCISWRADALFPYLRERDVAPVEPGLRATIGRNVRALFLHKAGDVVVNNTDNLVLTYFAGIVSAGLYSNYYLIIASVGQLCREFFGGIAASVGNLGVTEDRERVRTILEATLLAASWVYGWCAICLFELLQPFIELSFGPQYLYDDWCLLVLCLNFLVVGLRKPSDIFHDSLGLFHDDRWRSVLEAVVNVVAQVLLASRYGALGVFLGMTVSILLTSFWIEPVVLYRRRLESNPARYFARLALYVVVVAAAWGLTTFSCRAIALDPLLTIACRLPVCVAVPNAVFFLALHRTPEFRLLWDKAVRLVAGRLKRGRG